MPLSAVDINCDMGEGFGRWCMGDTDDSKLMNLISSASVATGFHAGDPNLMNQTVRLAVQHGVNVGAHPGYKDLQGFGRRKIDGTSEEVVNDIVYQVGALREFCRRHDTSLQHVKPHGALYMEMAANAELSRLFIQTMRTVAPNTPVFCMGISETYRMAKEAGQPTIREFYADRDYDDTGSIVFTRHAGKLRPEEIAEKVVRACLEGKVRTITGGTINIEFESICFHSDSPGSFEIASAMREALVSNDIRIVPVLESASS